MGSITAGGILKGPVDNLLHCTDSNRPGPDAHYFFDRFAPVANIGINFWDPT